LVFSNLWVLLADQNEPIEAKRFDDEEPERRKRYQFLVRFSEGSLERYFLATMIQ
jgi:hypothetical protein